MDNLASDVVRLAREVLGVYMEEKGEELIVGGPYKEMVNVFPKLKSRGFRFHSPSKTWRIQKDKLSRIQLRNVQKLVDEAQNLEEDKKEEAQDFIRDVKSLKTFSTQTTSKGFILRGNVFDFKGLMYDAGGKWDRGLGGYVFSYASVSVKALDMILKRLKVEDSKAQQEKKEGEKAVKKLDGRNWGFVKAWVRENTLWIHSTGYEYRDLVKDNFSKAKWESSGKNWLIPLSSVFPSAVESFIKQADALEEQQKQSQPSQTRLPGGADYVISVGEGYGGRPFRKGEVIRNSKNNIAKGKPVYLYVIKTKETYYREDGMSLGVGDESGYVYTAYCREATEKEVEPLKEKEKDKLSKSSALRELEKISMVLIRNGRLPSNASPQGKVYYTSGSEKLLLYGGGSWFIIGSGGRVWFVINNSADGDNWANTNIGSPGFPGAIGRYSDQDGLAEKVESLFSVLGIRPK